MSSALTRTLLRPRELLLHAMVLSVFAESVGVGPASVGRLLAVAAVGAAVLRLVVEPERVRLPRLAPLVAAGLLTAWAFASTMWSDVASAWLGGMLELALALGYLLGYVVLVDSPQQVRRLLVSYVLGATLAGLLGMAQLVSGVEGGRSYGLQGDPNLYAMYEAAAVPLALALATTARRRGSVWPVVWVVCALVAVGGLLASQSRGGLVALTAVLMLMLWRGDLGDFAVRHRLGLVVGGGSLVAGVLAWLIAVVPRFDLQEASESGGTGRLDIWLTASQAWLDRPVLGIGLGQYEAASSQLLSSTPGVELDPYSEIIFEGIRVHNMYLEMLTELGPLGLMFYLALLGVTGLALLRVGRLARAAGDALLPALLPMLAVFVTATVFLSVLNNKLLWLLVALAAVLPQPATQPHATEVHHVAAP